MSAPAVSKLPLVLDPEDPRRRPTLDKKHRYWLDAVRTPGVTTILGVLEKPALPWWGMTIGVKGALELLDIYSYGYLLDLEWPEVVQLLTKHRLTVNHVKDAAGDRGNIAHDACQTWAQTGAWPNPADIPPEAAGYVQAAAGFIVEMEPEPVAEEVMVWTEDYAGTFDLLAWIDGDLWLIDYKTSKRVYATHDLQLAAYEYARRKMGLRPADGMAVVHLESGVPFDVERHFVPSLATADDFLAILSAYKATERLKSAFKAAGRK